MTASLRHREEHLSTQAPNPTQPLSEEDEWAKAYFDEPKPTPQDPTQTDDHDTPEDEEQGIIILAPSDLLVRPLMEILYKNLFGEVHFGGLVTARSYPGPAGTAGLTLPQHLELMESVKVPYRLMEDGGAGGYSWVADLPTMKEMVRGWGDKVWRSGGNLGGSLFNRIVYQLGTSDGGKDRVVTSETLDKYAVPFAKMVTLVVNLYPDDALRRWTISCKWQANPKCAKQVFLLLTVKALVTGNLTTAGALPHKDALMQHVLKLYWRGVASRSKPSAMDGIPAITLPRPEDLSHAAAAVLKCARLCLAHAHLDRFVFPLQWLRDNLTNSTFMLALAAELPHFRYAAEMTVIPQTVVAAWCDDGAGYDRCGKPFVTAVRVGDEKVSFQDIAAVVTAARERGSLSLKNAILACVEACYSTTDGLPLSEKDQEELNGVEESLKLLLDFRVAGPNPEDRMEIFGGNMRGTGGGLTSSAVMGIIANSKALTRLQKYVSGKKMEAVQTGMPSAWQLLPTAPIWDMFEAVLSGIWASLVFVVRPPSLATIFQPGAACDSAEAGAAPLLPQLVYRHERNTMELRLYTNKHTAAKHAGTLFSMDLWGTRCLLVISSLLGGPSEAEIVKKLDLEAMCTKVCGPLRQASAARLVAVHLLRAAMQRRDADYRGRPQEGEANPTKSVREASKLMMHSPDTHLGVHYENLQRPDPKDDDGSSIEDILGGNGELLTLIRSKLLGLRESEISTLQRSTSSCGVLHTNPRNREYLPDWRRNLAHPTLVPLICDMKNKLGVKDCVTQVMKWLVGACGDPANNPKQALALLPCGLGKTSIITYIVAALRKLRQQVSGLDILPMPCTPYVIYVTNLISVANAVRLGFWLNGAMEMLDGRPVVATMWRQDGGSPDVNCAPAGSAAVGGASTEVLLVTPEGACTPSFQSFVKNKGRGCAAVIIDEAHTPVVDCTYRRAELLFAQHVLIPGAPVLWLTATLPPPLIDFAWTQLPFSSVDSIGERKLSVLRGGGGTCLLPPALHMDVVTVSPEGELVQGFRPDWFESGDLAPRQELGLVASNLGTEIFHILALSPNSPHAKVFGAAEGAEGAAAAFRPALIQVQSRNLAEALAASLTRIASQRTSTNSR